MYFQIKFDKFHGMNLEYRYRYVIPLITGILLFFFKFLFSGQNPAF
jgi:hypothetical protein